MPSAVGAALQLASPIPFVKRLRPSAAWLHCAAAPQTTEALRSDFEESLDQLQQGRSWGRSQDAFSSMSAAHPGDLVSAAWRAAAAHNAGCAALRLGQLEEAAESFARALNLSSGETSDAFAAVAAVCASVSAFVAQRALVEATRPSIMPQRTTSSPRTKLRREALPAARLLPQKCTAGLLRSRRQRATTPRFRCCAHCPQIVTVGSERELRTRASSACGSCWARALVPAWAGSEPIS